MIAERGLDRRNLGLLAAGQALGMSGVSMLVLIGGVAGSGLAPSPVWSTLPGAVMVVGLALTSAPAALLMQRVGRRRGFLIGSLLAVLGSLLGALAMARGSFALLCAASALIGSNGAFVSQYRFAAAESADPAHAAQAVSLVLGGGLAAGLLGPALGSLGKDWFAPAPFAGSFLLVGVLYAASAAIVLLLREPGRAAAGFPAVPAPGQARPLARVLRQPQAVVAVLAGVVSYAVMTFTMTAAPVSMQVMEHQPLRIAGYVVQSHIAAMYLPSFFSGFLVARLGLSPVMFAGVILLAGSAAVALLGGQLALYWTALVMLGLGWNFLFVGGTTLLTRTYLPSERFRVQAVNELLVFGFQAAASLLSGAALFSLGWRKLNLLTLPLLALMAAVLLLRRPAHR